MASLRWQWVLMGAVAFLAAHVLERMMWLQWFADQSMVAWFTNSGRAVLVTVGFMFVAGFLSNLRTRDRQERMLGAANVAGGGILALVVALVMSGAGTIFPLVIIIGAVLIIAGTYAGAFIAQRF